MKVTSLTRFLVIPAIPLAGALAVACGSGTMRRPP